MIASRAGRATGWRALLVLGLALTCAAAGAADVAAPVLGYRVVATYPHDVGAFTQGLLLHDGALYESLGGYGESRLRRVELASGRVLAERALDRRLFAEGLALADGRLYQLTWRAGVGFVYDAQTFAPLGRFRYPGEGWGLTFDGQALVLSDGTATLRFLDPVRLTEVRRVEVRDGERPVPMLNELEWIEGEVWANVWQTDRIARIDPRSGTVVAWIDLGGLLPLPYRRPDTDVLNGIAWDAQQRRVLVTGKRWPKLFAIELPPR